MAQVRIYALGRRLGKSNSTERIICLIRSDKEGPVAALADQLREAMPEMGFIRTEARLIGFSDVPGMAEEKAAPAEGENYEYQWHKTEGTNSYASIRVQKVIVPERIFMSPAGQFYGIWCPEREREARLGELGI
jgi:hypothetical protein